MGFHMGDPQPFTHLSLPLHTRVQTCEVKVYGGGKGGRCGVGGGRLRGKSGLWGHNGALVPPRGQTHSSLTTVALAQACAKIARFTGP